MPNVLRRNAIRTMSARGSGVVLLCIALVARDTNGQPARKPVVEVSAAPVVGVALPVGPLPGDHARAAAAAAPMPTTPASFLPPTTSDVVAIAIREYRLRGVAPVVSAGAITIYPFGHGEAVLTCAVLRACIVELEPGEVVVDEPIAGDQARWIITRAKAGAGAHIALVVVKPKACDITTNLIIPTDRRIYDLTLDAPPCPGRATNPKPSYLRHIRFYFPDDNATLLPNGAAVVAATPSAESGEKSRDGVIAPHADSLNHAYRIQRERRFLFWHRSPDFPWFPGDTWDDGAHVYIAVPPLASRYAAAVLYALEDDGSRALMNYTIQAHGDTMQFVTDRVFHRAVLVIVSGSVEHTLELVNDGWNRAAPIGSLAKPSPAASPETKP